MLTPGLATSPDGGACAKECKNSTTPNSAIPTCGEVFDDGTGDIEILTQPVQQAGPAVTNVGAAMRKREHQPADFGGKGMMLSIPSRV